MSPVRPPWLPCPVPSAPGLLAEGAEPIRFHLRPSPSALASATGSPWPCSRWRRCPCRPRRLDRQHPHSPQRHLVIQQDRAGIRQDRADPPPRLEPRRADRPGRDPRPAGQVDLGSTGRHERARPRRAAPHVPDPRKALGPDTGGARYGARRRIPGFRTAVDLVHGGHPRLVAVVGCLAVADYALERRSTGLVGVSLLIGVLGATVHEEVIATPAAVVVAALIAFGRRHVPAILSMAALGLVAMEAFEIWRTGLPHDDRPHVKLSLLACVDGTSAGLPDDRLAVLARVAPLRSDPPPFPSQHGVVRPRSGDRHRDRGALPLHLVPRQLPRVVRCLLLG